MKRKYTVSAKVLERNKKGGKASASSPNHKTPFVTGNKITRKKPIDL